MAFGRTIRTDFNRTRSGGRYDLDELSPRPDDALLSGNETPTSKTSPRPFANYTDDQSETSRRGSQASTSTRSDGASSDRSRDRGKMKAVANAYPNSRRAPGHSTNASHLRGPDLWRPPFASSNASPQTSHSGSPYRQAEKSWLGSILHSPRRVYQDDVAYAQPVPPQTRSPQAHRHPVRAAPADIDTSFTILRRREHEITKQIQYYLNQQERAHESSPMGQMASGTDPASAKTPDHNQDGESQYDTETSSQQAGHIIPVRQPRKKPISLRGARNGITNSIALMADLKSEEDAQVAEAVAVRKKALAKLQGLQSRMASIDQNLGVMQDTATNPPRRKLREKREKYTELCSEIKAMEERLRQMKLDKGIMERQMEELQSKLDSDVSGYQGAKRECEEGLKDLMRHPGVPALDVQDLGFKDWHEIGFKFLEQPGGKRRADMAREWWEGDLRYLEEYRDRLATERDGLEEGGKLWLDAVEKIIGYEQRLSQALGRGGMEGSMVKSQSDPKTLLLEFYQQMRDTIRDLEDTLKYAESQGMTLLVATIGAEVMAMQNGKDVFTNLIQSQGWEVPDDSRASTPTTNQHKDDDLVDVQTTQPLSSQEAPSETPTLYHDADEELTRSVIRRWETPHASKSSPSHSQPQSLRGSRAQLSASQSKSAAAQPAAPPAIPKEDSEVSDQLLFDPGRVAESNAAHDATASSNERNESVGHEGEAEEEEDDNEVPAGLLSEIRSRPESRGDTTDDECDDDNAVPKEFLSMHG